MKERRGGKYIYDVCRGEGPLKRLEKGGNPATNGGFKNKKGRERTVVVGKKKNTY